MVTRSSLPRWQRKAVFTATLFERHRRMAVPLSRELRARYGRRQVPLRKGDTVRILSGSYAGREERVAKVDLRGYSVTLDNVTGKTADVKLKPLAIRPSHLVLTRLNLADPWRRRLLRVAEVGESTTEEVPPAGAGGTPAPEKDAPSKSEGAAKPRKKAKTAKASKEESK
jgi:large subunit ribosomal protein L24